MINRLIRKTSDLIEKKSVQVIGVSIICVSSFLSLTLIPYHNVILFPSYWYETIPILELGARPSFSGVIVMHIRMILEYHEITKPSVLVKIYVMAVSLGIVIKTCVHLLWSLGLGYNSPIPFSLL